MFCVAMRRDLWERVGPLDEQFEFGMFEDEDYAMRVQAAGYRVDCAEDSFVHHFGQASLGKLAATDEYGPLFHANRKRWEEKWGRPWEPEDIGSIVTGVGGAATLACQTTEFRRWEETWGRPWSRIGIDRVSLISNS